MNVFKRAYYIGKHLAYISIGLIGLPVVLILMLLAIPFVCVAVAISLVHDLGGALLGNEEGDWLSK